jgi:HlyD family secretion protein
LQEALTMRLPRVRFTVRWAAATAILVTVIGVLAVMERREHLRSGIAISRAETAYRDAKFARELAEAAVKEYDEGTFRQELATADGEIRQAENELSRIKTTADTISDWAERIRSKGYLLLVRGSERSKDLAEKMAAFSLESAKSKKLVLEGYTRVKRLKKLNDRVANARMDELAKQAAYDRLRATPVGFIGKIVRHK